jgi:hypothetical protein
MMRPRCPAVQQPLMKAVIVRPRRKRQRSPTLIFADQAGSVGLKFYGGSASSALLLWSFHKRFAPRNDLRSTLLLLWVIESLTEGLQEYWRATPTKCVPFLGVPVSSMVGLATTTSA